MRLKDTKFGIEKGIEAKRINQNKNNHDMLYRIFAQKTTPYRYEQTACYLEQKDWIRPEHLSLDPHTWKKHYAVSWWTTTFGPQNKKKILVPPAIHAMNQRVFIDILKRYCRKYKNTKLFNWGLLSMGWTIRSETDEELIGDVSALLIYAQGQWWSNAIMPYPLERLIWQWKEKYEYFLETIHQKKITALMWVTSWLAMFLDDCESRYPEHYTILKKTLECIVRWWVDIEPYRNTFNRHGITTMMGIYNAAEWVIGYQDITYKNKKPYFLFAQTWFYELAPRTSFDENWYFIPWSFVFPIYELTPEIISIYWSTYILIYSPHWQVRTIMDSITIESEQWTSKIKYSSNPLDAVRFRISWRLWGFINRVGEELMEEQVRQVMMQLTQQLPVSWIVYTVAPTNDIHPARHERLLEFDSRYKEWWSTSNQTNEIHVHIIQELDNKLASINGDYDDKRRCGWLQEPLVHILPQGSFYKFLESEQKRWWQNKILHVSEKRDRIEKCKKIAKIW
jgi:hypothetical protein